MAASSPFSSSARDQVRHILSQPPYRTTPSHPPRPLAGLFHALGRGLNAAFGRPARWLYHHLLLHIGHGFKVAFGGWWVVIVGVMAVGLGVAIGFTLVQRRTRIATHGTLAWPNAFDAESPDDIDIRATAAEEAGDHETAVRLRFRAGLLRLQQRGILVGSDAQTDRQLSARLRSNTFDALAGRHEVIVFAQEPATPSDSASARTQWPRVFDEVRPEQQPTTGAGARQ